MTATSQKFDTLDGLLVTGNTDIGGGTLIINSADNRVSVNGLGIPSIQFSVYGNTSVSENIFIAGEIQVGTKLVHSGDIDTFIAIEDGSFNLQANGDSIWTANTSGLTVESLGIGIGTTDTAESVFQDYSTHRGNGALASDWIYTNFIESSSQGKDANTTGLGIGDIFWDNNQPFANTDVIGDAFTFVIDGTLNAWLNKTTLTLSDHRIVGAKSLSVADEISHFNDPNTKFAFNANDSAKIIVNNTDRLTANIAGTFITGDLDITANTTSEVVKVSDYFAETVYDDGAGILGNYIISITNGSVHTLAPTGDYSVAFIGIPTDSDIALSFTLVINNGGTAHEATWPAEVNDAAIFWAESVEPPASVGIDIYNFVVVGGQVYGSLSIRNAGWAQ